MALFKVLFEELISVVDSDDILGSTRFTALREELFLTCGVSNDNVIVGKEAFMALVSFYCSDICPFCSLFSF